ncbi:MAG: DUF4252 domain-containing protein [Bacteroidales bacterium]|jgi:hypothetical protein
MKRILFAVLFAILAVTLSAQKSIDRLFDKYSDNENFVTVKFNGSLLKFLKNLDSDNDDSLSKLPGEITEVRILAQEKDNLVSDNFFKQVMNSIGRDEYEEFMHVNKEDENMVMLVKAEGTRFREFLLVAGGKDNVLIQVKGNISFNEAKNLSEEVKRNHTLNLLSDRN